MLANRTRSDRSMRFCFIARPALGLVVAAGLASCAKEAPPPEAAPAIEVTAVTVIPRDIPATYAFVGKTESARKVEIRARVQGFLEKRSYKEGEIVKAGQTLFLMDRKPFEAQLKVAKAALGQQEARLRTARANLNRVRPLAAQNAVSQKDLDDAIGQEQAAAAAVEAAKAEVIRAELDLGYTTIGSPVEGLSSFAVVQDGSYVDFSNSLLTYVSALSPMRVSFSVSENQILKVRDEAASGRLDSPGTGDYEVEVVLADGSVFPEKGRITFADAELERHHRHLSLARRGAEQGGAAAPRTVRTGEAVGRGATEGDLRAQARGLANRPGQHGVRGREGRQGGAAPGHAGRVVR